ncbi:DUF397 domain-containing protein [Actinomadura harenae]|uniref:DUF397 domain-containing protein n=1 Tax=Actinomadura harenae TaxID=2483351 RepID=A0A3M2MDY7_9ACTN|nr:DUF397 domain-containing protein [Actinomadura harenae]RMI46845.1 DUF397 domain-containing protein [Actinomadura harenae]
MDLSQVMWRKASKSKEDGSNCIEVGAIPSSAWRIATRSSEAGDNCVEVAGAGGGVALRDSKKPDGGVLVLTRDGFGAVLDAAKAG